MKKTLGGVYRLSIQNFPPLAARQANRTLEKDLQNQAFLLVEKQFFRISETVTSNEPQQTRHELQSLIAQSPRLVYAYVFDDTGHLFAHSFPAEFPAGLSREHHLVKVDDPEISHGLFNDHQVLDVGFPLVVGRLAHVHLGLDEDLTRNETRRLLHGILIFTLVLMALSIFLGLLVSWNITRPLAKLAAALRDPSINGPQAQPIPVRGGREVRQLTEAFNTMLAERQDSILALQTSEERIRATFNAISDPVFLHPLQQEGFAPFIQVNDVACEVYGYSREEFLHLKADDITIKSDAHSQAKQKLRQNLRHSGRKIFETFHIKKTGEKFPVEINSTVIELDGGPVILSVARDLTIRRQTEQEKEELQQQLRQARKMESIGRLAGGIAHDFNNYLSVVLGHCELALLQTEPGSPAILSSCKSVMMAVA